MRGRRFLWLLIAATGVACGPPAVRPVAFPDPLVSCPGGRTAWRLEIVDQRAEREDGERLLATVRDGITRSFPGCRWSEAGESAGATLRLEIYRFRSDLQAGHWDAVAQWGVLASDSDGRAIAEFEVREEADRPNYQGYDGERESLSKAYEAALQRTIHRLTALPAAERRPLSRTPETVGAGAPQADVFFQTLGGGGLDPDASRRAGAAGTWNEPGNAMKSEVL